MVGGTRRLPHIAEMKVLACYCLSHVATTRVKRATGALLRIRRHTGTQAIKAVRLCFADGYAARRKWPHGI